MCMASWIPHMDWFFVDVIVSERCRRWWEWLLGGLFAKENLME
jgi:hypothetical protein